MFFFYLKNRGIKSELRKKNYIFITIFLLNNYLKSQIQFFFYLTLEFTSTRKMNEKRMKKNSTQCKFKMTLLYDTFFLLLCILYIV